MHIFLRKVGGGENKRLALFVSMIEPIFWRVALLVCQSWHYRLLFICHIICITVLILRLFNPSKAFTPLLSVRLEAIADSAHIQADVEDSARHGGREMLDSEGADAIEDYKRVGGAEGFEGVEEVESSVIVGLHRKREGPNELLDSDGRLG